MPLPRLLSNDAALSFEGGVGCRVTPKVSTRRQDEAHHRCRQRGVFTTRRRWFPLCAIWDCNDAVARLAAADKKACKLQLAGSEQRPSYDMYTDECYRTAHAPEGKGGEITDDDPEIP
jgi:hypothetical protein